MSTYYRHLIENNLLLDLYPNAAVAYSLRKLRDGYTGDPIRVRRGIDSAEQDIPFLSNGNLDTINVEDFCGYNLATFSQDISNTVWTKTNLNTTGTPPYLDVAVAPDGTTTADKMIDTAVSAIHRTSRTATTTAGVSYNISVYLKAGERRYVQIQGNITGTNQIMNADLLTGIISSNTFSNANLVSVGSGWYRFDYTSTSGGGATSVLFVSMQLISGGSVTYLGDGLSGIYIWGYQFSQTSSVKTYQATTSFAGGTGFVYIWYDQSGNSRNAEQTTPGNQAQIVSNGNIIRDALTLKPTTTWSADRYTIIGGVNPITRYLSIGVLNRTANSNVIAHIGVAGAISGVNGQQPFLWQPTTGIVRTDMFIAFTHGTNISTGAFITTSEKNASDLKTVYLNGTALALTAIQAPSLTGTFMNSFGQNGGNFTTCQYQEYIYWNSEQSANRVAIETLINNYYAVY